MQYYASLIENFENGCLTVEEGLEQDCPRKVIVEY